MVRPRFLRAAIVPLAHPPVHDAERQHDRRQPTSWPAPTSCRSKMMSLRASASSAISRGMTSPKTDWKTRWSSGSSAPRSSSTTTLAASR
jgi:hypothetical protein